MSGAKIDPSWNFKSAGGEKSPEQAVNDILRYTTILAHCAQALVEAGEVLTDTHEKSAMIFVATADVLTAVIFSLMCMTGQGCGGCTDEYKAAGKEACKRIDTLVSVARLAAMAGKGEIPEPPKDAPVQ